MHPITNTPRIGILGGGQLGRMLAHRAIDWNLDVTCLDPSPIAPAARVCPVLPGDFKSYDDVVAFGRAYDVVTVESDSANAAGLAELAKLGVQVAPCSEIIRIVQDKGLQRLHCREAGLPVPRFELVANPAALRQKVEAGDWQYPFIVKTRTAGYDGKGVFRVTQASDLDALPDVPLLVEEQVAIAREFAAIGVRNRDGDVGLYPLTEVHVVPGAFLADYLTGPVDLSPALQQQAEEIVRVMLQGLQVEGLLAVELFLDQDDQLWVNECSPRPHNTGHHTIEAAVTSQYENHLRGILNLPIGSCKSTSCAAMLNVLGAPDASGPARYEGIDLCMRTPGAFVHLYGKPEVRPHRKMGHVTLVADTPEALRGLIDLIKPKLAAVS